MKASELAKILQAIEPETEVCVCFKNDEEADKHAKAELIEGECLNFLEVGEVRIMSDDNGKMFVDLIVSDYNWQPSQLEEARDKFDEKYPDLCFWPKKDPTEETLNQTF